MNKTTVFNYLFGSWDRKYTFLSAALSVVSIFLTLFLWKFPETIPTLIIIRDIIIIFGLLLISGVLLLKYIKKEQNLIEKVEELKTSNVNLSKMASNFHSVNHKFRNELFTHFHSCVQEKTDFTEEDKIRFEKICHSLTLEVKKTFINFFESKQISISDDIVITVKLTISSNCILMLYGKNFDKHHQNKIKNKEQWVLTVYRDPESYEKHKEIREVGVKLYDIDKNTAFIHIFKEKRNVFACNDLGALGDAYLNENSKWKEFYNSTAVAPIRYYNNITERYMYFGLLAVDSKNPKKYALYENEESRHILGHAADLMANYFLSLSISPSTSHKKS